MTLIQIQYVWHTVQPLATHSDCCVFALCRNILTYLFWGPTYKKILGQS